jgi:hypothetical protein
MRDGADKLHWLTTVRAAWRGGRHSSHCGKPSCLISCSHASPLGGCDALVGRQGGIKPGGSDMVLGYQVSMRGTSTKAGASHIA